MKRRKRYAQAGLAVAVVALALSVGCSSTWQPSGLPTPKTAGQGIIAANATIEGLAREATVLVQGGAISADDGARVLQVLGAASIMVDQVRTDIVDPNSQVDVNAALEQVEALIASARDMIVRAERR